MHPEPTIQQASEDLLQALNDLRSHVARECGHKNAKVLYGLMESVGITNALKTFDVLDQQTLTAAENVKRAMHALRRVAEAHPEQIDHNLPHVFRFANDDKPRLFYLDAETRKYTIPKLPDTAKLKPGADQAVPVIIDLELCGIFSYAAGRHPIFHDLPALDQTDDDDDQPRKGRRR